MEEEEEKEKEEDIEEVEPADSVWLLMGKEYRISRSIRLQWFFQHLKSVVTAKPDTEIINSTEELEVLSILPDDVDNYTGGPLCVMPTTKQTFIGRQYRFVFCIDMSPSLATIDTETGEVLIDVMFENLKNCLTGLVQPFRIPGSLLTMNPRLHVTILAHIDVKECRVLVQGYCVNKGNVKQFLCKVKRRLQHLEKSIAEELQSINEVGEDPFRLKQSRTSLFYMICDGLVALQLLPDNASAGIVVVTDGVFILDNAMRTDALLTQVRTSSAVCSFLQVGTGYRRASVEYGYVPHCALMQFIATTTSGAYLANSPPVKENDEMNLYHKSLYCLHFQRDIDIHKIDSSQTWPQIDSPLPKWSDYLDCLAPFREIPITQHWQTMRYNTFELKTRISSVLTVRLREGYIVDGIQLSKNDTQIEVKLIWPWKEHITIEYIARAAWPLDLTNYLTHVSVNVSGPYEFLVDIAPSAKPKNHKPLRKTVLLRFDQTMKSLDMSDQLLVHLQFFPVHLTASKIPDTVAKGFPLFFMPANSNTPIIALQYQSSSKAKKSSKSPDVQFANFWKSVVTMDTSTWWNTRTWAKWWHIHRINILPKHNTPVTKGLFIPSSTNQYPHINCRAAINAFNKLLKEWCSFILLENHSYVKFMSRPGAEKPHTFCLLRLTFKGLCIGLRMAFLAGTPGVERFQVYGDLKESLMKLTSQSKKDTVSETITMTGKPSIPAESKCLIILTKQVERILVKYDSIPEEVKNSGNAAADTSILNVTFPIQDVPPMNQYSTLQDAQASPGRVLSQYLFNQRWVWCMRSGDNAALDAENIALIMDAILKQRLHEGFHFWIFNKGIISLVKEVDVMVDSSEDNMSNCCVIQYVLFPPHQKSSLTNNMPDDSDDTEEDMQMVVEVWVEPQFGTMDVVDCPLDYIKGVEYKDIPSKMFDIDAQIVTEISSYLLIHAACVKRDVINHFPYVDTVRPVIPSDIFMSSAVVCVPFLFQTVSLLQKSRLILSIYPMMKEVSQGHLPEGHENMNDVLLSFIKGTLSSMNDCEIPLLPDDRKLICEYIQKRCTSNNDLLSLEESTLVFNENDGTEDIQLSCFIKSFGSRMIIMILPNSVKDLELLLSCTDPKESDKKTSVNRKNLPFFIFECDYKTVQDVPSSFPSEALDILQDYTEALNESALVPRHLNQKLPDDRSKDIAMYCQALYDHYFWALVSGVYKCLLTGYKLDPDDVELSIDLVCEETIQEIDLTDFLKTTCSHYNEIAKSDYVFSNDESLMDSLYSELGLRKTAQVLQKSNSNESRRSVKSIPRSITSVCENIPLQHEIQRQFREILGRYFHSIPGNSCYMFFRDQGNGECPAREVLTSTNTTESSMGESPSSSEYEMEDSDVQMIQSEMIPVKTNSDGQRPMFLYLTCSCHYRSLESGHTMRPISIKNIPTCLNEITNKLDLSVADIDPSSLSIKMTLICLTQPAEPEQDEEWVTPKKIIVTRQNSSESCQSVDFDRQKKYITTQDSHDSFIDGNTSNSFNSLPLHQRKAITKVINDVRWLLQDEIASALRLHIPLNEESLVNVATHVENSIKAQNSKTNCIFEKRYFMFVTGTEKATDLCLPVFVSEVKKTMLGKYKLTRVGKYWCVVIDSSNQLESEAEGRMMFEEVKERARLTRRGMSHRRSQSDSKYNRLPLQEPFDATDFNGMICRTTSLPAINFPEPNVEEIVVEAKVATSSADAFHPLTYGSLWQTDAPPLGLPLGPPFSLPVRISEYDSSKGTLSSSSSNQEEDRELRRSVSYTEEKSMCETTRRSFSLSDIYRPGSSCDCLTVSNVNQPLFNTLTIDYKSSNTDYIDGISNESSEFEEEQPLRSDPHFWLFMEITEDSVLVYCHRRRSEQQKNIKHQKNVYNTLLESLDRICKVVNQKILLDNLHSTNNCHNLLLPEDEDQVWSNNQDQSSPDIMVVKNKEINESPFSNVIHGEYRFKQGYFECELVWEERIIIHNRLRTSNRANSSSRALLAVRNVLEQFRVGNRKNLFVFKESKDDQNIFYFRVKEGSNENDYTRVTSPQPDDDHYLFTPVREDYIQQSRASSISSLVNRNEESNIDYDRFNYDRQESYQSGQYLSKVSDDKCSISETSSHIHNMQDFLHFCVYGIRDPGKEIKEDLVKMMKNKLDKTTLDIINQSLTRNLKCKLSPQDVEFIQPPGETPSRVLTLCVSNFASKYLHAMIFYLHQYLLDKYCNPRYTIPDGDSTFKNYSATKSAESINVNDVYLYNRNRREKEGNYGIAIAYLRLVDIHDNKVTIQPSYPSLNCMELNTHDHVEILKQLVVLKRRTELSFDDPSMCQNIFVQFNIWTCGDIELDSFEKELTQCTLYALYDVFLEYHLLCTPICFIPTDLQFSSRRESSQRSSWGHGRANPNSSNSSAATTPKLMKSHPTLKKFSSEPTTPSDMQRESPLPTHQGNISKDDLNLVSDSPKSYSKGILGDDLDKKRNSLQDTRNSPQRKDVLSVEADKKRSSYTDTRQSPLPKRDSTREESPVSRQVSVSSKNSFQEDEILRKSSKVESPSADLSTQPKTITMNELNQLKDVKDATYVMLTDAEVHESLKAVTDVGSDGNHDGKLTSTWQEVEMQRRIELDKRKKGRMLEHGSTGELHSNYHVCCAEIFDHMISAGNPNIHKQEGFLTHQYMLETVMKEFKKEMEEKSPDMKPKVFKEKKSADGDVSYFVQYYGSGFKTEDSVSDTPSAPGVYPSVEPDEVRHFIVIGHNAHKWLLSMGISEAELSDDEEGRDVQEEQSKQKFKPYIPVSASNNQERWKVNDVQPPSCIASLFVPRQKFFIALFYQRKITVYTYNYSSDVTAALDRQLKRLYAWQNVRTHLNACLFMQKFGLFHHKQFVRDCPGKEDPDTAVFASSSNTTNLLPLMKEVSPRSKERSKPDRIRVANIAEFDEVFRNTSPSKVLHNTNYFQIRDLVRRQAHQYQDVRNIKLQRASTEVRLREIFEAWKDAAPQVPITEDRLMMLKKHSRLIHHCAAPILIGVGEDEEAEVHDEEAIIELKKSCEVKGSPHSYDESESGMVALDWCQDVLRQYIQYLQTRGLILVQIANKGKRPVVVKGKTSSLKLSRTSNRSSDGKDTVFAEENQSKYYLQQTSMAGIILMEVFVEKNYLCYNMLGFESMSLNEISIFISMKDQRNFFEDCGKFKDLTYITSFTYDYHIRQLHLHLCGRRSIFPKGYPVHTLIESIIQHYPTPPRFCTCILSRGVISVPNPHGIIVSSNTVYNYLVINSSSYGLSKVDVSRGSSDDLDSIEPGDYMLRYNHSAKYSMQPGDIWRSRREIFEYDGNVALQFKSSTNSEVIEWPFFLVLVNRVEFYPRPSFVPGKRRQKLESADNSVSEPEIVTQRSRLVSKHANSTGSLRPLQHSISISQALTQNLNNKYSPKDVSLSPETASKNLLSHSSESEYSFSMTTLSHLAQKEALLTAQQELLVSEMKFVEEEVSNVCSYLNTQVENCLGNCLRDLIWNGLLITDTVLEDDSLSKKVKKKSSAQSFDASSLVTCIKEWKSENRMDMMPNLTMSHLTFNSIKLLVELVTSYRISDIDRRVSDAFAFIQPGLQQKVIRTLNCKYSLLCRQFLSDDGETTLLCIINPRNLDMIMLVVADEKEKCMDFSVVYRSEPSINPLVCTHDESLSPRDWNARNHIENVISCLCYDIWLQSLPT